MPPSWLAVRLEAALGRPKVEQMLARNLRMFHLLGEGMLPKLVMGNYCASGRIQYPDAVFAMLEDYLGIRPKPGFKEGARAYPLCLSAVIGRR